MDLLDPTAFTVSEGSLHAELVKRKEVKDVQ